MAGSGIEVEVVAAWPRHHLSRRVRLPPGATVDQGVRAAGIEASVLGEVAAFAVHGERVEGDCVLRDGDRIELLRPLRADPKEARRLRAERQRGRR